jgi:hypothetical protein
MPRPAGANLANSLASALRRSENSERLHGSDGPPRNQSPISLSSAPDPLVPPSGSLWARQAAALSTSLRRRGRRDLVLMGWVDVGRFID